MRSKWFWPICLGFCVVAGILCCFGCSNTASPQASTESGASNEERISTSRATQKDGISLATRSDSPQAVVRQFLEAIRRGDDTAILRLYTSKARRQAQTLGEHFAPKGSDTASYTVGDVEYLSLSAARVAFTWTDLGPDGTPQTDEGLWVLRREEGQWRVAGLAVKVIDDRYLVLDFEDLERTKAELEAFRRAQLQQAEAATEPHTAAAQPTASTTK